MGAATGSDGTMKRPTSQPARFNPDNIEERWAAMRTMDYPAMVAANVKARKLAVTADLIREAGTCLFGPRFTSDLARLLGVSDRTVRRWCAGTWEPLPFVWPRLREAILDRQIALQEVKKRLPHS